MKNIVLWLYRINLLLLLFWGAHAWPLWFLDELTPYDGLMLLYIFTSFVISIVYYQTFVKKTIAFSQRSIIILLFLFLGLFYMHRGLLSVLYTLQYFPVIILSEDKKNAESHLRFLTTVLSVVLVPGIIFHFYGLIKGFPPSLPVYHPFSDTYMFFQYIVEILSVYPDISYRFESIFLEPAFLATMCVGFLYADKFQFNKIRNIVLLVALILSFSLLGYITFILLFVYQKVKGVKLNKKVLYIVTAGIFLIVGFWIATTYNDGDNMVNNLIVQRLLPDDEKGIAGNNRNSETIDNYFSSMLLSGEIITGKGALWADKVLGDDLIGNAGYKTYLMIYGLISVFLFSIVYYLVGPAQFKGRKKSYAWGFLLVVFLSFLSGGSLDSWYILIPLLLGIGTYKNETEIINKEIAVLGR